ncbi:cell wall adhesin EAP1-like [Cygnus olor]|uniref:cell wall adhesin EAP1-like n=1 Tax=Cygnus olor TaxID=8869 RepID=UPI001ADE6491|nr:cell wall adhesin EAP1-like [Cygnus olor]
MAPARGPLLRPGLPSLLEAGPGRAGPCPAGREARGAPGSSLSRAKPVLAGLRPGFLLPVTQPPPPSSAAPATARCPIKPWEETAPGATGRPSGSNTDISRTYMAPPAPGPSRKANPLLPAGTFWVLGCSTDFSLSLQVKKTPQRPDAAQQHQPRASSPGRSAVCRATRSEPYTHTKPDSAGRNHPTALGAAPTSSRALPAPQGMQACT